MKLQKTHQEMDRISILPQDINGKILSLMPIRDALRTSILSKKWRYCWTTMPRLEFPVITSTREHKHKLVKDIFHVLMLHKGPMLEFSMRINNKEIANEIDPIILYLSRNNNIKKFHFEQHSMLYYKYKLPSSFFSLQGLEHIVLVGCTIKPPLNFNGFRMLRGLGFNDCHMTFRILQQFLTNCPLLEEFTLERCDYYFAESTCTYVELFKCLSSVQILKIYNEDFAEDGIPQKLPTPLVHLRIFDLHVSLQHDDLSLLLCVINSSPNLEKIIIQVIIIPNYKICVQQEVNDFLDSEDYSHSDLNLDKLEQLEIRNFQNLAREIGFVKLVMAKAPVLKKAQMQLSKHVSVDEEVKMLRDLVRLPFPRASPTANFIIKR